MRDEIGDDDGERERERERGVEPWISDPESRMHSIAAAVAPAPPLLPERFFFLYIRERERDHDPSKDRMGPSDLRGSKRLPFSH